MDINIHPFLFFRGNKGGMRYGVICTKPDSGLQGSRRWQIEPLSRTLFTGECPRLLFKRHLNRLRNTSLLLRGWISEQGNTEGRGWKRETDVVTDRPFDRWGRDREMLEIQPPRCSLVREFFTCWIIFRIRRCWRCVPRAVEHALTLLDSTEC